MFESGYQSNILDKTMGSVKNDKIIKEKNAKLNKLVAELTKLKTEKVDLEELIQQQKNKEINLQTEIDKFDENLKNIKMRKEDKINSMDEMVKNISNLETEIKDFKNASNVLYNEVTKLNKEISTVSDVAFKDFLKKVKAKSIEEYEGVNVKDFEEYSKIYQMHKESLSKVNFQIEQLGVNQSKKSIGILAKEKEDLVKELEELKSSLEEDKEELEKKTSQKDDLEKDYGDFKSKQNKNEFTLKKCEDELNLYKMRFHELSRLLQERKYDIKSTYAKLLHNFVMIDIIDDKKAQKLNDAVSLELELPRMIKKIKKFEDVKFDDLGLDEITLDSVDGLKTDLQKELESKQRLIENYERVSMLAPR